MSLWPSRKGSPSAALGGRPVRSYPSTEAILEAVANGREKAGYVISTRGAWLAQERWPGKLAFLPAAESLDRFPLCAAVRKTEGDLKDAIDRAWDELDRSGELAKVFARWHIPYDPARSPSREKSQGREPIRAAHRGVDGSCSVFRAGWVSVWPAARSRFAAPRSPVSGSAEQQGRQRVRACPAAPQDAVALAEGQASFAACAVAVMAAQAVAAKGPT